MRCRCALSGLEADGTLLLVEPEDFTLEVVQSTSPDGGLLSREYGAILGRRVSLRLFPFGTTNVFGVTLDGFYREPVWDDRLYRATPTRTDAYGRVVDTVISAESLRVGRVVSDWRTKAQYRVDLTPRGMEQLAVYEDAMREGSLPRPVSRST